MLPPACGVNRVIDSSRPVIVGSVASVSRLMLVAAPVRSELNAGSDCAVTVTLFLDDGTHVEDEVGRHAEVHHDVFLHLRLEADRAGAALEDRHAVGAADAHPRNREVPVRARERLVGRSRREMDGGHAGADHRLSLHVLDDTHHHARRDALRLDG